MPQYYRLDWDADQVDKALTAAAVKGLELATEHLLQISRAVVPLEEGTLERSGAAQVDDKALTGAVSYDTVYAVRQHEELTWRHAPGRQAKYLEGPATAEADTLQAIVAAQIRRAAR